MGEFWIQNPIEKVKEVLKKNGGLITPSAKELGIERMSLYYRIRENPDLKVFLEECREDTKDTAESVLYKKIKEENLEATKYYLSHCAKDRGYGDTQDFRVLSANVNTNIDITKLSTEELEILERILTKSTSLPITD